MDPVAHKEKETGVIGTLRITPGFLFIGAQATAFVLLSMLTGASAPYYLFFNTTEIACTLLIIRLALEWKPEAAPAVAMVPIAFINMLNTFAPMILLGNSGFLKAFEPAQLLTPAIWLRKLYRRQTHGLHLAGRSADRLPDHERALSRRWVAIRSMARHTWRRETGRKFIMEVPLV
jgi:hypothetical protein